MRCADEQLGLLLVRYVLLQGVSIYLGVSTEPQCLQRHVFSLEIVI